MAERTGSQGSTGQGTTGSTKGTGSTQNRNTTGTGTGTGTTNDKSSSMKGSNETFQGSTPGISHSAESGSSTRSTAGSDAEGLLGLLQKLGLDEQHWKSYVSDTINTKVQDIDYRDVMERAKEYASMSGDKLKDLSTRNPKMFYSGLAAFLLGAGMMANAARTSDNSISGETLTVGDDPRPIKG